MLGVEMYPINQAAGGYWEGIAGCGVHDLVRPGQTAPAQAVKRSLRHKTKSFSAEINVKTLAIGDII